MSDFQTRVLDPKHTKRLPGLASEAFILVDTQAEASFVNGKLNDDQARAIKKQRLEYLGANGVVDEVDMPDTATQIELDKVQRMSVAEFKKWLADVKAEAWSTK